MDVTLSDFIPFFKMFPGIYQVINEKLIEEIESYPYGDNLENLVRNSIVNDIEEVRELILLGENKLLKDFERRDDSFFKKTELEVPLEIHIGGGDTLSVIITFCIASRGVDFVLKLKHGMELYIVDNNNKEYELKFLNIVEKIYLDIKNKDGSNVRYTLLPGAQNHYQVQEPNQSINHGKSHSSSYYDISYWGDIKVSGFSVLQDHGDSWKRVTLDLDSITIEIKKGNLLFEIPLCSSKDTDRIYIYFKGFKAWGIRNLPGESGYPSDVFYFFNINPLTLVVLGNNKARFFMRVSYEDILRNLKYKYIMKIEEEGIYVTDKPVSFKLFHSPLLTLDPDLDPWFLILEDSYWEKVSSIPSDAFEVKICKKNLAERLKIQKRKEEHLLDFFADKETLLKLPFFPEILDK